MGTGDTTTRPRDLTDEEWCELCFKVMDLEEARELLAKTLLAEERPTLRQLWLALAAYQRSSDSIFEYVAGRLRLKADIEHQHAT